MGAELELYLLQSMSCEQLYSLWGQNLDKLAGMINYPRKLLRRVAALATYPFQRGISMLEDYSNMLKAAAMDFAGDALSFMNSVHRALRRMLDCPFLADMFGAQIAAILDALNAGAAIQAIFGMFDSLKNAIVSRVRGVLDKFAAVARNTVSSLTDKYKKLLDTMGVTALMQMLSDIQDCIGAMCGAYKAVKPHVDGFMADPFSSLGFVRGDDGLTLDLEATVIAKARGIKTKVKTISTKVKNTAAYVTNDAVSDTCNRFVGTYTRLSNELAEYASKPITLPSDLVPGA